MELMEVYGWCRAKLAKLGIRRGDMRVFLCGMIIGRQEYQEALECWADYREGDGWSPSRWHSEWCYDILTAGLEIGPAELLERLRKEYEDENGVFTGP